MTADLLATLRKHLKDGTYYSHYGDLIISDRDDLRVLPDIYVTGRLELINLPNLSFLPLSVSKCKSLSIVGCGKLTRVPNSMNYDEVTIVCCGQIKTLPHGFIVKRNLSIIACDSFESIPNNCFIGETLKITGCRSLSKLGHHLWIGKELFIENSRKIELPDDLYVDTDRIIIKGQRRGIIQEVRVEFEGKEIPPIYPSDIE